MGDFERWIYVGIFLNILCYICHYKAILPILQQFLTALLRDIPKLSLTQLNIEKLDEEENASITCELIFQLNKDK